MELRIKASDRECMEYALTNLEDLKNRVGMTGRAVIEGSFSGIRTEVTKRKGVLSISCIRGGRDE